MFLTKGPLPHAALWGGGGGPAAGGGAAGWAGAAACGAGAGARGGAAAHRAALEALLRSCAQGARPPCRTLAQGANPFWWTESGRGERL